MTNESLSFVIVKKACLLDTVMNEGSSFFISPRVHSLIVLALEDEIALANESRFFFSRFVRKFSPRSSRMVWYQYVPCQLVQGSVFVMFLR